MLKIPYREIKKLKFPFGTTSRKDWFLIIAVGTLVGIALCWSKDIRFAQFIMPPAMILYCMLNLVGDRNLISSMKKKLIDPHTSNPILWDIYLKKINYPPRMKQQISLDALRNPLDLFILGRMIQCHAEARDIPRNQKLGTAMITTAVNFEPKLQNFLTEENLALVLKHFEKID